MTSSCSISRRPASMVRASPPVAAAVGEHGADRRWTAKDEVDTTKVTAFDIGADDYVVKPAALREVEARSGADPVASAARKRGRVLAVGDLEGRHRHHAHRARR